MTTHKCDMCGKEITVFLRTRTDIQADNPLANVGNLLRYPSCHDFCPECYDKIVEMVYEESKNE